jgi:hypothetical protein
MTFLARRRGASNLDVTMPPKTYEETPWRQEGGTTIFNDFPHDTEYFGDRTKQWMINFRVTDVDAVVARPNPRSIRTAASRASTTPRATRFSCGSQAEPTLVDRKPECLTPVVQSRPTGAGTIAAAEPPVGRLLHPQGA